MDRIKLAEEALRDIRERLEHSTNPEKDIKGILDWYWKTANLDKQQKAIDKMPWYRPEDK